MTPTRYTHAVSMSLVLLLGGPTLAWGQLDDAKARQIVRDNVDRQGNASESLREQIGWRTVRGFQWRLLLEQPDGSAEPVASSRIFRTGERFRAEIEPICDLWVYVLTIGNDGEEAILLPEASEEHLLARKGRRVQIPSDGGWFRFADPPGKDTFRILASPRKLSWVNPQELFELESGGNLGSGEKQLALRQKSLRSREIDDIRREQRQAPVVRGSLAEALEEIAGSRDLRSKNTVVLPPPNEDVQFVLQGSPEPASPEPGGNDPPARPRDVLLFDVELLHR